MQSKSLLKFLALLISICFSIAIGHFVLQLSGRAIPADFVRPFLAIFLAFLSVFCFIKANTHTIALLAHFAIAFPLSLIMTLAYLYYDSIDAVFTGDDVVAIAQSNIEEIYDFFEHYIFNLKSVLASIGVLLVYILFFILAKKGITPIDIKQTTLSYYLTQKKRSTNQRKHNSKTIQKVLISGASIFLLASLFISAELRPAKFYRLMLQDLEDKLNTFHQIANEIKTSATHQATKKGEGELYVLVIGESLSRDSMGLYNQSVNNNPFLQKLHQEDKAFVYANAYSSFVNTVPSITASFSQGNFKTGLTFPKGDNLISLAQKAGIKTYWISNQVKNGKADTPIGAISSLADYSYFTTNFVFDGSYSQQPDLKLLPKLKETFSNLDHSKNNLVIIHLMGNHSPYYNRFPHDYPIIKLHQASQIGGLINKPPFSEKLIGASDYENYLTSIRYNDEVLQEISKLVLTRKDFQALVYYSDHGEALIYQSFNDIAEENKKEPAGRHNIAQFSYAMTRIPLVVSVSDSFKQKYPQTAQALHNNLGEIFTNDTLYDFMLDLMQVKSDAINYSLSIANPKYARGEADEVMLVNNKSVGDDPDYLAYKYAHHVISPKLIIKSANSTFKANSSIAKGYRNLHINTIIKDNEIYVRATKDFDNSFIKLQDFIILVNKTKPLTEVKQEQEIATKTHYFVQIDNLEELITKALMSNDQAFIDNFVKFINTKLIPSENNKTHKLTLLLENSQIYKAFERINLDQAKAILLTSNNIEKEMEFIKESSQPLHVFIHENLIQKDFAKSKLSSLLSKLRQNTNTCNLKLSIFSETLSVQEKDLVEKLQTLDHNLGITSELIILNYFNAFDSDF